MSIPLENQLTTVLTPVFGDEIYPIVHPDPDGTISAVANMFGTYSIIGGQSFNKLDGDDAMSRVRISVSIYSIDYTEMKTTQAAVAAAMQAANLLASQQVGTATSCFDVAGAIANVSSTVPIEDFEHDTRRFSSVSDFYCWARA